LEKTTVRIGKTDAVCEALKYVDAFASVETMTVKITNFSTTRYGKLVSAISAILIFLFLPALAAARKPQLPDTSIVRGKTAAGFNHMSGGSTFDEQQAMERQSAPYNLKLVFAPRSATSDSPILLLIGDNQSRQVDRIVLHGPWFYIQLPPGGYTIVARIKNKVVLIRDVYLRENRRSTYFVRGDQLKSNR
jgi:hypothetical protein